jgi:hypothetical protein
MSLSSMHEHEVEDITDWCIDFIKTLIGVMNLVRHKF